MIAVARTCSLIFIILDVLKPLHHKKLIEKELEGFGIRYGTSCRPARRLVGSSPPLLFLFVISRLNKQPPNIGYKKKDKGGLNLTCVVRVATSLHHPPAILPLGRFLSQLLTSSQFAVFLLSTVCIVLMSPCGVTPQQTTSLMWLKGTGENYLCCVCARSPIPPPLLLLLPFLSTPPLPLLQSVHPVYLHSEQDRPDLY